MILAVARHCGQRITRTDKLTSGWLVSPGYPIKYTKDLICDWEINVRPNYQVPVVFFFFKSLALLLKFSLIKKKKSKLMTEIEILHFK